MNNVDISVVVPVYKGEKMLRELVDRLTNSLKTITDDYEIVLVNDASPDKSWEGIADICKDDNKVVGINLSRNFGQHYAITAGLDYADGDWVVVMDCDLQDRPEEIPNLYAKAMDGWDIVQARRTHKQFGVFKKLSSWAYHQVFDWLAGKKTDPAIGNFGIYKSDVICEVRKMTELARSFPSLLDYVGFSRTTIDVKHAERAEGKSSYTIHRLLKLAFDIAISNTNKPLRMAVTMGLGMSMISLLLALYNVVAKFWGFIAVPGYTTIVFSIWFVGGLVLLVLGVVGLYVGKIFDQVKERPLYIVKDIKNK